MLKINMEYRKGILFIRLKGNLINSTHESLINYLIPIIKDKGIKYIVFNLEKIDKIDKYGKESLKIIINEVKKVSGIGLICNCKNNYSDLKIIENELVAFDYITI